MSVYNQDIKPTPKLKQAYCSETECVCVCVCLCVCVFVYICFIYLFIFLSSFHSVSVVSQYKDDDGIAQSVHFVTPSVTSLTDRNPTARVYWMDPETYQLLDYDFLVLPILTAFIPCTFVLTFKSS